MTGELLRLAFSLHQQGRLDQAVDAYQRVLAAQPRNIDALNLLGQCHFHRGAYPEALKLLNKCLKLKPDFVLAHRNVADVHIRQGDLKAALAALRRVIALDPGQAEVHGNLGFVQHSLGRDDEALTHYRQALAIDPRLARVHRDLALTLSCLGRPSDAEASLRRAIELEPDFALAHNDLGNVLLAQRRADEAAQSLRRALEIDARFVMAYANLARCALEQGRLLEAENLCRKALEIDPGFSEIYVNLGATLKEQGRYAEAETLYRQRIEHDASDLDAYSHLLSIDQLVGGRARAHSVELARRGGEMLARRVGKRYGHWPKAHPQGALRVGFVSGDLREHPVGYFLESVLAQIDPARIELVAYPTVATADAQTGRLRRYFSVWRPLVGLGDKAAAQAIHDDGIMLLVDLSGHTAANRLPLFAWKPAPVQVSWLGYFATTGLAEIDYLIADEVGVPPERRDQFTEAVCYLPDTRLCYTPPGNAVDVGEPPALRKGYVTFGCFQQYAKIGDAVLAVWARILAALPDARLRLQTKPFGEAELVERFKERCRRVGLPTSRIDLHGAVPRDDYLAAHNEVDLILDTFPYPGGTTTCDALWMGVPTLTLAGETLLARQGASLLSAAGLPEWIADDEAAYVAKAVALAGNVPALARLRASLRQQVLASPLFDAARFARNLEDALWRMWHARSVR
jgi:predicted O-linked N-acetylglucosamine transferase (SPINDLY family)